MASVDIYSAINTYVVYKEETAWGAAATPAGTDYIDRVTSINCTMKNNRQRFNAIGEGANATSTTNGSVEISGSITAQLTNAAFFKYLIVGDIEANTGTESDPSDINEVNVIGYTADVNCPSITIEFGNNGTVDDVIKLDGVTFSSWRLSCKVGEPVTWNADYRARYATRAASGALTYTAPTDRPLCFIDGTLVVGSDTVLRVDSFEISGNNNINYYYNLGSRFLAQPTMGTRRYDFTITVLHSADTTASKLSGVEIRELLMGAASSTVFSASGAPDEFGDMTLTLTEGSTSGDNTIEFQFENCYLEEISEPIEIGDTGGPIMLTITGYALSGLTNSTVKTPIEYYTHT
ncbi:MAG TPA: hypothetical protein ENN45_04310 [Bacteroidetes bacterium]|nr:hypothetical protein [Bacteroidota bacterium]